jgi:hypothetical protein
VAVVVLAVTSPALAEVSARVHVRTWDVRARQLVRYGLRQSALARELAARLDASDVYVYVEQDCELPTGLMGRLSFMAAAPRVRYLSVRLSCKAPVTVQIAALGHELRHAVEIADDPSIVDEASLVAGFRRIGFPSHHGMPTMESFDTQAAIDAGAQVWREIRGHASVRFEHASVASGSVEGPRGRAD